MAQITQSPTTAQASAASAAVDVLGMGLSRVDFENAITQCNSAKANMTDQQATLRASWTGEASSAFGQALQNWLEDLSFVITQLNAILSTMGSNTTLYSNTHQTTIDTATQFGSTQAGLQGL